MATQFSVLPAESCCPWFALGGALPLLGSFYGQIPGFIPAHGGGSSRWLIWGSIAGLLSLPLPAALIRSVGVDTFLRPWPPLATECLPFRIGSQACTTPVLAVLLAWTPNQGRPLIGMTLLTCLRCWPGSAPCCWAGSAALLDARLLDLRPLSR